MKHIKQAAQTITKIFIKSAIKLVLCLMLFVLAQTAVAHKESECKSAKSSKSNKSSSGTSSSSSSSIDKRGGEASDATSTSKEDLGKLIKKANEGDLESQYKIGAIYFRGNLVKQDFDKALFWLKKVAEKGCPGCGKNSGWIYFNNGKRASFWFKKRPRFSKYKPPEEDFKLETKVK